MPEGEASQPDEEQGKGQESQPDEQASLDLDKLLEEALAEVDAAVDASDTVAPTKVQPLEELPPERHIAIREQEQDLELKGKYGRRLLSMMILQLGIADAVFVAYAWAGKSWNVPTESMHVWLGATLVEVIGVVYVVTRYLFPTREA